jgi:hypothetical protein
MLGELSSSQPHGMDMRWRARPANSMCARISSILMKLHHIQVCKATVFYFWPMPCELEAQLFMREAATTWAPQGANLLKETLKRALAPLFCI